MTNQQQTDLQLWKQDQSQPLPASLKNVLIEDCLEELKKEKVLKNVNEKLYPIIIYPNDKNYITTRSRTYDFYSEGLYDYEKVHIIQTFLSMPFLDVVTDYEKMQYLLLDLKLPIQMFTETVLSNLQLTLIFVFTFLLSEGKTFEEAYKIINLIYLQNV